MRKQDSTRAGKKNNETAQPKLISTSGLAPESTDVVSSDSPELTAKELLDKYSDQSVNSDRPISSAKELLAKYSDQLVSSDLPTLSLKELLNKHMSRENLLKDEEYIKAGRETILMREKSREKEYKKPFPLDDLLPKIEKNDSELKLLKLSSYSFNSISKEEKFADALMKNTVLTELNISFSFFETSHIPEAIAVHLRDNFKLRQLTLLPNFDLMRVLPRGSWNLFSETLKNNTLTHLTLSSVFPEIVWQNLNQALINNANPFHLSLSGGGRKLCNKIFIPLLKSLHYNTRLKSLDFSVPPGMDDIFHVSFCGFRDFGEKSISGIESFLKRNITVRCLNLSLIAHNNKVRDKWRKTVSHCNGLTDEERSLIIPASEVPGIDDGAFSKLYEAFKANTTLVELRCDGVTGPNINKVQAIVAANKLRLFLPCLMVLLAKQDELSSFFSSFPRELIHLILSLMIEMDFGGDRAYLKTSVENINGLFSTQFNQQLNQASRTPQQRIFSCIRAKVRSAHNAVIFGLSCSDELFTFSVKNTVLNKAETLVNLLGAHKASLAYQNDSDTNTLLCKISLSGFENIQRFLAAINLSKEQQQNFFETFDMQEETVFDGIQNFFTKLF